MLSVSGYTALTRLLRVNIYSQVNVRSTRSSSTRQQDTRSRTDCMATVSICVCCMGLKDDHIVDISNSGIPWPSIAPSTFALRVERGRHRLSNPSKPVTFVLRALRLTLHLSVRISALLVMRTFVVTPPYAFGQGCVSCCERRHRRPGTTRLASVVPCAVLQYGPRRSKTEHI